MDVGTTFGLDFGLQDDRNAMAQTCRSRTTRRISVVMCGVEVCFRFGVDSAFRLVSNTRGVHPFLMRTDIEKWPVLSWGDLCHRINQNRSTFFSTGATVLVRLLGNVAR